MNKYQIGDHVASQSGLVYIVTKVNALDDCGSFGYDVRRCRGGQVWGPTRHIAECDLFFQCSVP